MRSAFRSIPPASSCAACCKSSMSRIVTVMITAPRAAPVTLPEPPRITIVTASNDAPKPNASGCTMGAPSRIVAIIPPARPPPTALTTNDVTLYRVGSTPTAAAAISSSRSARSALPHPLNLMRHATTMAAIAGDDGRRVRAEGEEAGVADRELPREAVDHVQRDGDDDVARREQDELAQRAVGDEAPREIDRDQRREDADDARGPSDAERR